MENLGQILGGVGVGVAFLGLRCGWRKVSVSIAIYGGVASR